MAMSCLSYLISQRKKVALYGVLYFSFFFFFLQQFDVCVGRYTLSMVRRVNFISKKIKVKSMSLLFFFLYFVFTSNRCSETLEPSLRVSQVCRSRRHSVNYQYLLRWDFTIQITASKHKYIQHQIRVEVFLNTCNIKEQQTAERSICCIAWLFAQTNLR